MFFSDAPLRPLYLHHGDFEKRLEASRRLGLLGESEIQIIDSVGTLLHESDPDVMLGLAFVLRAQKSGHVGLDLRQLPKRLHFEKKEERACLPEDLEAWQEKVLASSWLSQKEKHPLFRSQELHDECLIMTEAMYQEQWRVYEGLKRRFAHELPLRQGFQTHIDAMFGGAREALAKEAVSLAARSSLSIITGGPGTGKTYNIKRLLLALLLTEDPERPFQLALSAPTGKAAVRMKEAIGESLDEMDLPLPAKKRLQELEPMTLHRLLRLRPNGEAYYNQSMPLPVDVLVVDEVSMVDLRMMRLLLEAVPLGARLILLGDKDQLASVDVGTVLADIVSAKEMNPLLKGRMVHFSKSHRFKDAPDISQVASCLQSGEREAIEEAIEILCGKRHAKDESLLPPRHRPRIEPLLLQPEEARSSDGALVLSEFQKKELVAPYLGLIGYNKHGDAIFGYGKVLGDALKKVRLGLKDETSLESEALHLSLLSHLDHYRVLAVHRKGALGVEGLLELLSRALLAHLEDAYARPIPRLGSAWLGRPLMVTQNTYSLGLMNGDIGLVLPQKGQLMAVFLDSGDAAKASLKYVELERLPRHSGALAMTIHKSQGSQFDKVAMVLSDKKSPLQTRELVYTAITRAKTYLSWLGSEEALRAALHLTIDRASGLGSLLSNAESESQV